MKRYIPAQRAREETVCDSCGALCPVQFTDAYTVIKLFKRGEFPSVFDLCKDCSANFEIAFTNWIREQRASKPKIPLDGKEPA